MTDTHTAKQRWPLHYQILAAMIVGVAIGVAVNPGSISVSDSVMLNVAREGERIVLVESMALGEATDRSELTRQTFDSTADFQRSFPRLFERLGDQASLELPVSNGRARINYGLSDVSVIWQREHEGIPAVTQINAASAEKLPAFWKELAAQHPAGIGSQVTSGVKFIGDLFLRMLKMITVPLILTSLVTGVAGLGQHGGFGRMISRTMIYYLVTSMLAIITGIILVDLIQPGAGAILPGGGRVVEAPKGSLIEIMMDQILLLIPANPFQALANGEFLSVISFSILLGLFISRVGGEYGALLTKLFEAAFDVMMKMTSWIISLAPIGVGAFTVYATATQGVEVFRTLAWYMLTVFIALIIHACITLPLFVAIGGRRNPFRFAQQMAPSLLTAFSTASSNAALPLTITCVEKRAGISNRISSFVLPLGATINMDGTALYEAVAVLFIAQATPGFELTLAQQIMVALTALLASVGAAGIPHAGLVMMAIVLQAVGLPLESQGIIIAVDRILDMCRTTVNVWSDMCGCAVVHRSMGEPAGVPVPEAAD